MQKLLREKVELEPLPVAQMPTAMPPAGPEPDEQPTGIDVFRLIALRDPLAAPLDS